MTCWTNVPSLGDINQYLRAIEKFPYLTPEEEAGIVSPLTAENETKLMLSHLRLAHSIAREYANNGIALDELIQIANLGLLRAVKKFDNTKGRFHNIATPYIRYELNEFVMTNSRIVKMTTTKPLKKLFWNLGRERAKHLADTNRKTLTSSEVKDIALSLGVKPSDVEDASIRFSSHDIHLDPLTDNDEIENDFSVYMADNRSDPALVLMNAERAWLETHGAMEALNTLDERSKFIVQHRYMIEEPLMLHEIATIFGISAERVRQIEVKALKKMREYLEEFA